MRQWLPEFIKKETVFWTKNYPKFFCQHFRCFFWFTLFLALKSLMVLETFWVTSTILQVGLWKMRHWLPKPCPESAFLQRRGNGGIVGGVRALLNNLTLRGGGREGDQFPCIWNESTPADLRVVHHPTKKTLISESQCSPSSFKKNPTDLKLNPNDIPLPCVFNEWNFIREVEAWKHTLALALTQTPGAGRGPLPPPAAGASPVPQWGKSNGEPKQKEQSVEMVAMGL